MATINVIVTHHIENDVTIADMRVLAAYAVNFPNTTRVTQNQISETYGDAWEKAREEHGDKDRLNVHLSFGPRDI